jgi:hypothetical protein
MRIYRIFIAGFVCFLMQGIAVAQDSEDAKRLRLAEELIELTQARQLVDQIYAQVGPGQTELLKSMLPEGALSDEELEIIAEESLAIMREELAPAMIALVDQMAPVYAEVYTLAELKGVVDFYKSPIGQAFIAKQSLLVERSTEISSKWAQETIPGVMQRMTQRLQARLEELQTEE